jgi:hypothetical protein
VSVREIIQKFPNPDDLMLPIGAHPNHGWLKLYCDALADLINEAPTGLISEADLRGVYMDHFNGEKPTFEELKLIEERGGKCFSVVAEWISNVVHDMKEDGELPCRR